MLEEKSMPKFYWAEAVRTVVYVQNRTSSARGKVSPTSFTSRKEAEQRALKSVRQHNICACAEGKVEEARCQSLEKYLGWLLEWVEGYKCYNSQTKDVPVSRDVLFDESTSWYLRPSPTLVNSILNSDDEASEAEMPLDKEEIKALEESLQENN